MRALESFSDADFRQTILRAIRLLLVLTAVALPFVWWRSGGWRGAAMLLVGAAISASGLWEWLRLLTAVMARMEAEPPASDAAGLHAEPPASDAAGLHAEPPASDAAGLHAGDGSTGLFSFNTTNDEVLGVERDPYRAQAQTGQLPEEEAPKKPAKVGGMGMLLTGFFVRLALVVLVLYGSLKYLEGSVVPLAAGLGLGVFSLTVEGLRLVKAWTV